MICAGCTAEKRASELSLSKSAFEKAKNEAEVRAKKIQNAQNAQKQQKQQPQQPQQQKNIENQIEIVKQDFGLWQKQNKKSQIQR